MQLFCVVHGFCVLPFLEREHETQRSQGEERSEPNLNPKPNQAPTSKIAVKVPEKAGAVSPFMSMPA